MQGHYLAILKLLFITSAILPGITTLICFSCDSLTHPGCGYEVNVTSFTIPTVECDDDTQCYVSQIDRATKRVVRGCRVYSHCELYGCLLCPDDYCNFDQEIVERCISCTSDSTTSDCEWNVASNYQTSRCPDTTDDKGGCYLQIKDNIYTRDCVANLDDETIEECKNGQDCKICSGDGCNSKGR